MLRATAHFTQMSGHCAYGDFGFDACRHSRECVGWRSRYRRALDAELRAGSVEGLDARTAAVVSYLFVELEPALIARCVREAGSDLSRANELYKETLTGNLPRNPRWEEAVAHLV